MRLLLYVLVAVLSGCATYATEQANAIRRGDLDTGERLAVSAIRNGHEVAQSWFNLGVVYDHRGRRDMAVRAFTMSARYGYPRAQQTLMDYKAPVPAADLSQQSTNSDGVAAALEGFNRGYSGGINCTSTGSGDLRFTNCR